MSRDALVVGINKYPFLKDSTGKYKHLTTPADDAEAIAQLLEQYGEFQVQRLPAVNQDGKLRVNPQQSVKLEELKKAITNLFHPQSGQVPETAILFFAGHGLHKSGDGSTEGYLATSDASPRKELWGLSLRWLRQMLHNSPVRQQIIWLDCCHSGELFNFAEIDLGEFEKGRDRCFIVASRDFQVAYAQAQGEHGVLSGALLQGLDPRLQSDQWVTNFTLVDFVKKALKSAPQHPICKNSGGQIILTGTQSVISNVCPYKGLAYFDFNDEDPKYFYGRELLTKQLIEKVRQSNFLAVLGASGSGKSSVVRAGLLHQLKLGEILPGSDRWKIYEPFTPGEHPLESLEQLIGVRPDQLQALIQAATDRQVLVVDQFEEVFTQCQDDAERQNFFECLLGAVEGLGNKLCLLLVMRADFQGKCAEQEYKGLISKIDQNLIRVMPMNQEELKEVIIKPAEQVGIEVERELVTRIVEDFEGASSNLPLLQYVLKELWQQKTLNRLTLSEYTRLGGVKKTLEKQANKIYESLLPDEQLVAKRIFLQMINIGEGTDDTRRSVSKGNLVIKQQSESLVNLVIERFAKVGLLITYEQEINHKRVALVEIAHEALIRHWSLLRQWVNKNREMLMRKQDIEDAAKQWQDQDKPLDSGYLLRGQRLFDAVELFNSDRNIDVFSLSSLTQEFIEVSTKEWEREKTQEKLQNEAPKLIDLVKAEPVEGLVKIIQCTGQSLDKLSCQVLSPVQDSLKRAIEIVFEKNICQGDKTEVRAVAIVPDTNLIISGGLEGSVRVWDLKGNLFCKSLEHGCAVNSLAISADAKYIVVGCGDGKVWVWQNWMQNPCSQTFQSHEGEVRSVSISQNSQYIVTGGDDKLVKLWDLNGKIQNIFEGHEGRVMSVAISQDHQYIISGGGEFDHTVRLWHRQDPNKFQIFEGHKERVNAVAFSPNGEYVVTGSNDKTARLWNLQGESLIVFTGHRWYINSVAFSHDGKNIASGSAEGVLLMWDLNGKEICKLSDGLEGSIKSIAFSPDNQFLVSGNWDGKQSKTLRIWDLNKYPISQTFIGHENEIRSVAFSLDSQYFVSGSSDKTIRVWNWKGNQIYNLVLRHEQGVNAIALSCIGQYPDKQYILSGSSDRSLRLWNLKGDLIWQLATTDSVYSVAFSQDGNYIVSGTHDGSVMVCDLQGRKIMETLKIHDGAVTTVAFSQDNLYVVSGGGDCTVQVWDLKSNQIGKRLRKHDDAVNKVAFTKDNFVISGSWDGTVRLWDLEGKEISQLLPPKNRDWVHSVAFSPDGQYIVTGSLHGSLRLWDNQGTQIGDPFPAHTDAVRAIAFSPDGQYIVSGSWDNTVRIWGIGNWQTWLFVACNRLRYHPVLQNPETEVAKQACEVCRQYIWGSE
jgi:WD40 repeat protein/energy-coupling factor transporter ATP-binding protein EcfA2